MNGQAIGYLRVSSVGQLDGDGFARQRAAISGFAQRNGLTIVEWIEERGVSGTTEGFDRPEFSAILERFDDQGAYAGMALIVERMDRLARDLMVQEMMLRDLRNRRIKLYAADNGTLEDLADGSADPTRILIRQVLGAVAQWERTMVVRKMNAAKARLREQGGYTGGHRMLGTDPANINQKEHLLKILTLCDAGMCVSMICRMLEAEGMRNSKGKPYDRMFLKRILKRHRGSPNPHPGKGSQSVLQARRWMQKAVLRD